MYNNKKLFTQVEQVVDQLETLHSNGDKSLDIELIEEFIITGNILLSAIEQTFFRTSLFGYKKYLLGNMLFLESKNYLIDANKVIVHCGGTKIPLILVGRTYYL